MDTEVKKTQMRCQNPQCGKTFSINTPQAEGRYGVNCPFCNMVNYFNVRFPVQQPTPATRQYPSPQQPAAQSASVPLVSGRPGPMLKLVTGGMLGKKNFVLSQGIHVIGRRSSTMPSEIEIKDNTMSCRSVRIDSVYTGTGYITDLTVMVAENPVYLNNKELHEGEKVQLKADDRLILGSTLFIVEEV